MRHWTRYFLAGLGILGAGCAADNATTPAAVESSPEFSRGSDWGARHELVVMSQNMYVGADVDAIITALATPDPNDDFPTLLAQIGVLRETDFPTRARAFADAIARTRPHVVGLMEVSKIDIDLTALGVDVTYHVDFLQELNRALHRRHLHYRVAGIEQNFVAAPLPGVSLTDYDALLVDARRVRVGHEIVARTYATNIGAVAPGVTLTRGFVSVPIEVDGVHYRVTSTHPEADLGGVKLNSLRAAQMQELVGVIGDARHAVIMGDLNDFPGTPMYQVLLDAGFTDAWVALRGEEEGFTCCHASNLTDARTLNQRIDYVFARGLGDHHDPLDGFIRRIGVRPGEMVAGPLHPIWASDHAGLVANLETRH
jgi:endonuclease/exonuclease/phosphatase family metal-dependent hydrolase